MTNLVYKRDFDYIPRIAAVHDLCGYGKCSLGVAIPVLSAAGCDVCPVPTGLFSSHTAFPGWYMHDTTGILDDYLKAWEGINVQIDAIYSGFLGDAKQVEIIEGLYKKYPKAIKFVDPVMADHGAVYPTYTPELCDAMKKLASQADVLTPNLTEAAIILGEPIGDAWEGVNITNSVAHDKIKKLLATGAKNVVLKGIHRTGENKIHNFIAGEAVDGIVEVTNEYVDYMLHGTGDVYASCVLAGIMKGKSLVDSVEFAGNFVHDAMLVSGKQPNFKERGVSFETILSQVTDF